MKVEANEEVILLIGSGPELDRIKDQVWRKVMSKTDRKGYEPVSAEVTGLNLRSIMYSVTTAKGGTNYYSMGRTECLS